MKRFLWITLLSSILGFPLTAQCDTNPSRPYQLSPSQRVPKKAVHYVQRINRTPIRYFHQYPRTVNPRSRTYRSYRSPRVYVYANPSCPPIQTETNYHIYHQYEYIQEYPVQEYYENNYYDSEFPSENSANEPPDSSNSYYVERRPTLETEENPDSVEANEPENPQNPLPIKDFFYFMETGREFFKRGRYEQAALEFSQAIVLDRYAYAAHWGHGMSLFAIGKYASASFSFRKGLDSVINPLAVHENLRRYYSDLSRFETQLDQLENYLQTYPFDTEAYFVLAFSQFYTQNYPEAQGLLEYILKIAPQDAQTKKLLQTLQQELERRKQYLPPDPSLSQGEIREIEDELLKETTVPETQVVPENTEQTPPQETEKIEEEPEVEKTEESKKPQELTEAEKQRIIEANNEKALENYEKLLKNARAPKKSLSEVPLEKLEKPAEEQTLPLNESLKSPEPSKDSISKPKARTRLQIQAEIQELTTSFQDQKFDLLNTYAQLKRQYYSQELNEQHYQEMSAFYSAQYDQLQNDFALRKEQLQTELNGAK